MSRIYLIGPIGESSRDAIDIFQKAQLQLEAEGHEVINLVWERLEYEDKKALLTHKARMISICDWCFLLPAYHMDKCALAEIVMADAAGIEIVPSVGIGLQKSICFTPKYSLSEQPNDNYYGQ